MVQSKRGMVDKIDFFTSFGHGEGGDHRRRLGITTKGPTLMITDLAVWRADEEHPALLAPGARVVFVDA